MSNRLGAGRRAQFRLFGAAARWSAIRWRSALGAGAEHRRGARRLDFDYRVAIELEYYLFQPDNAGAAAATGYRGILRHWPGARHRHARRHGRDAGGDGYPGRWGPPRNRPRTGRTRSAHGGPAAHGRHRAHRARSDPSRRRSGMACEPISCPSRWPTRRDRVCMSSNVFTISATAPMPFVAKARLSRFRHDTPSPGSWRTRGG